MSNTAQYTDMKDSGIKWIGSVPVSWNVRTIYQLATQVKNKNSDLTEQNLLSLSYGKIKRKDINTNDGLLPASFDGYNIIEEGDIVLRLTDLQNDHTSLRVGHATERGIITSAYTTLRPINPEHSRYLYYLIHAFDLKKGFYGMGSGVRQGLNYDEVKELRVVIPSQKEQNAIVSYLDTQCSHIDAIIQEAKDNIIEYKKWYSTVIFEMVTKGLNATIPFCDSGEKWIGSMPAHWSKIKIGRCFRIIGSGTTPKSEVEDYYTGNVAWLQSGDINGGTVSETSKHINEDALRRYSTLKMYEPPYIAIAMYGASIANICIVEIKSCTNQACCVLSKPEDYVNFLFAKYAIQAAKTEMILSARGGTQPNISQEIIKQIKIPIPPKNEQKAIAENVDYMCNFISSIIKEKEKLISDLEAYKRSLIYETVTGKRKVV